ncbi:MAG: hypothetical protein WA659_06785 [Candidatus Aquirickettsiella sp.]
MNRDKITLQQSSFFQVSTKQRIEKWVKDVNRFSIKSIYNLTWNSFYKELHKLGVKEFLKQYGYSCKKKLQLVVAKSEFWQSGITLYDFEKSTEKELLDCLGNNFFNNVARQRNFNAKNHKLSTIHYLMYHRSLHFTAISLGFSSKQCFLNFFAQTTYTSPGDENGAQNLRVSIQSLYDMEPSTLRKKLAHLYDKPLIKNKNFLKYNYTLEELKLALENENNALVMASLGGGGTCYVNKKLQTLRPLVDVSLGTLKQQSWESLKGNTPIFIWKIKLYQLFSNPLALDQWSTAFRPLHNRPQPMRSHISYHWQFFTSRRAQEAHTDTPLNLHHSHPSVSSFYATEIAVSERYVHTYNP